MKKFKKPLIIGGIIVVILAGFYFLTSKKQNKSEYSTVALKKTNLVQTVSEVGTVKAQKEIELNFAAAGKVNKILVKSGDIVKKDQVLAELNFDSLKIREQEAQSSLEVARANLNKLLAGATPSDIAIVEAQANQSKSVYLSATDDYEKVKATVSENISQATKKLNDLKSNLSSDVTPQEQAISTAELNLSNTKNTYQQSIDNNKDNLLNTIESKIAAANTALDYVNRIISDDSLSGVLSAKNSSYLVSVKNYYDQSLASKDTAATDLSSAKNNSAEINLSKSVASALSYLNLAYKTTTACFNVLESTITSSSLSQTQLETFKTNINSHISAISSGTSATQTADYNYKNSVLSYKNNVASAEDALSQARVNFNEALKTANNVLATANTSGSQQLAAAKSQADNAREAWSVAQKQLAKIRTSARPEDISLSQAQVAQAEASLNLVKQQQSDSTIKAPIDGQITKINYEIGEQVSATKSAITMLTENNFEVEVDISEADIAKIKIDNPAIVTFDAFGESRKFAATVYFVEPASTVIQDVIYYKVKVKFIDEETKLAEVKAGMTANVTITTNNKNDVYAVPNRAIIEKNGSGKFVRLLVDNNAVEVPVKVGISGNEGMVEISSREIKDGDLVITFVKTPTN